MLLRVLVINSRTSGSAGWSVHYRQILQYKGYRNISEIMPSIRRFTVDNPTDPRSGSIQSLNFDWPVWAAARSPKACSMRAFFSLHQESAMGRMGFAPGVTYGIGTSIGGGKGSELPLYERFFPGGVGGGGDVRGYALYSLGPDVTLIISRAYPSRLNKSGAVRNCSPVLRPPFHLDCAWVPRRYLS